MPLPSSGTITLAQIQAEFGGANPVSLSEYYKGGAYVSVSDAAPNVPASGIIRLSNFHGAGKNLGGQVAYTVPGTYTWVCPAGVTSVCVVCVGAGGRSEYTDSSGGSLVYGNNIPVTPGVSYTVGVGSAGGSTSVTRSYFAALSWLWAEGGGENINSSSPGGGAYITGGGIGGAFATGGGGAGGYTGKGGRGGLYGSPPGAGEAGQGGGGSGGYGQSSSFNYFGGGGGGVGILGQGASGAAPTVAGQGGFGGSGGANGVAGGSGGSGGSYGGGNGFRGSGQIVSAGSSGAVRIIWGAGRSFPSTNTGNL